MSGSNDLCILNSNRFPCLYFNCMCWLSTCIPPLNTLELCLTHRVQLLSVSSLMCIFIYIIAFQTKTQSNTLWQYSVKNTQINVVPDGIFSYLKVCPELQQQGTTLRLLWQHETTFRAQPGLHSTVVMKFLLRNISYKGLKDLHASFF